MVALHLTWAQKGAVNTHKEKRNGYKGIKHPHLLYTAANYDANANCVLFIHQETPQIWKLWMDFHEIKLPDRGITLHAISNLLLKQIKKYSCNQCV